MITAQGAKIAGLGDQLGRIRAGAVADLVVLERHHQEPWESVLLSDRRSVELLIIAGDLAYGRAEWMEELAGPASWSG